MQVPRRARRGCGARASRCWNSGKTCWAPCASAAENAARLLALQTWVAAECAAGRAPVFGNADPARETLRAEQGKLERADAGGTAVYSLRIRAEYIQLYTEETP